MQKEYAVVVGNIGTVYYGSYGFDARVAFNTYRWKSKRGEGRYANEPVTLMLNDEIHDEYTPLTEGDM